MLRSRSSRSSHSPSSRAARPPRQAAGDAAQGGRDHRHRRPQRQGLQRALPTTASRSPSASTASRAASSSRRARRTTSRTSRRLRAGLQPRDRGRLPDGRLDRRRREEVPEDEVRDHRRLGSLASRASRRTCAASSFSEQEAGCLAGVAAATVSKSGHDLVGRRPQDPARRRVHRRLPEVRQERRSRSIKTLNGVLAGLHRSGQVQGDRAEPDRPGLGRRLPGRRRLRPRRAHCRQGLEGLGHRRRQRPELPRPAHPHERDEEGRRGRHADDQADARTASSRVASTVSST